MEIFISHASDDGAAIRSLVQDLEGAGKQVWLDHDLKGGEAWWTSILNHIRACKVFIFAVSDNSLKSKPCRAELDYASALGLPILPVQIGEVKSFRIDSLFTKQSIDYRTPTSTIAATLIGALDDQARRRKGLPDPLPDPPPIPYEYLQLLGEAINGPAPISYQEQTEILTQLRQAYRDETDPDVHDDIRTLLDSLQQRPDTARTTVEEIASIHKTTPRPVPPHDDRTPLRRRSWERHRTLLIATIILITTAAIGITGYLLAQHHMAPRPIRVAISEDGFGVVVGADDAPAKIDIFMELQCPGCRRFDAAFSGDIARKIEEGQLQVTYRPLTFEDERNHNDYSKRAANAMFLAASPDSGTSQKAISNFIAVIFNLQGELPNDAVLAGIAKGSGIPSQVVERIAARDTGVDVVAMDKANNNSLEEKLRDTSRVPAVYDTLNHTVVDIVNPDWLNLLMKLS